ncbi:hypothetical protein B0T19DRAFT_478837 [Cercophora scortea]|uniref:F-box domain-containing protein n=1 Tax=Cercophora scortea TaxID=314031 RepID=A0AAE0I7C0_9PEZI|nr:hypothetical protein B0T19DRAFT_478837 [Cercophora scortea]
MTLQSLFCGIYNGIQSRRQRKKLKRRRAILPRAPTSKDPKRPSFINLPNDILWQIVYLLQDTSPSSVTRLVSVCSSLHATARRIQHRRVSINLNSPPVGGDEDSDTRDRLEHMSRCGLLPAVRSLKVLAPVRRRPDGGSDEPDDLSFLVDLLLAMTALRGIKWDIHLWDRSFSTHFPPEPTSRAAESETQLDKTDVPVEDLLHTLTTCSNLVSLRAKITYVREQDCRDVSQALRQVLLSCPNLRALSLDLDYPRSGCFAHGPGPETGYLGLGLHNGERPPPLESLEILCYPWGQEFHAARPCLYSRGYPETGTEPEYWANTFDWSRLRRLYDNTGRLAFSPHFASNLTALKEVKFPACAPKQIPLMQDFFAQLPSTLEVISIPKLAYAGGAEGITTRHGQTLHKLEIHLRDWHTAASWADSDEVITPHDLTILRSGIPNLQELSIDMARPASDWPRATLDILAGFPRLSRLTLCVELGQYGAPPLQPEITKESVTELFRYLRARSPASLRRLYICAGVPPAESTDVVLTRAG